MIDRVGVACIGRGGIELRGTNSEMYYREMEEKDGQACPCCSGVCLNYSAEATPLVWGAAGDC